MNAIVIEEDGSITIQLVRDEEARTLDDYPFVTVFDPNSTIRFRVFYNVFESETLNPYVNAFLANSQITDTDVAYGPAYVLMYVQGEDRSEFVSPDIPLFMRLYANEVKKCRTCSIL